MRLSNKEYAQFLVKATQKGISAQHIAKPLWTELSRHRRLKDLDEIINLAKNIEAEENGLMVVNLTSAQKINSDDLENIKLHLAHRHKKKIIFVEKIDESIGAGVIIDNNGYIYNLSLKERVGRLKKAMTQ